jgi:hypothetical protein
MITMNVGNQISIEILLLNDKMVFIVKAKELYVGRYFLGSSITIK